MYSKGQWHDTAVFLRADLRVGDRISSPALIIEPTGTNVVEPGWEAELARAGFGFEAESGVRSQKPGCQEPGVGRKTWRLHADPVLLEIFNNLFRAIAEEMGVTLQNTSASVNIKERLDFSCALFNQQGELIANAPHIPVHLGSMSESVASLIASQRQYAHNRVMSIC